MGGGAQRKRGREVREFDERNRTFPARGGVYYILRQIRARRGHDKGSRVRYFRGGSPSVLVTVAPHQFDLRRRGD
jgi:hypothetical protein